jgi:hypothetical protein
MSERVNMQPTIETMLEQISVITLEFNQRIEDSLSKSQSEIANIRTDVLGLKGDVKFIDDRLNKLETRSL